MTIRLITLMLVLALCHPTLTPAQDTPDSQTPPESRIEPGHIQIQCEPGIEIFLDGIYKGGSKKEMGGIILKDVSPGTHTVKAVREGFQPLEQVVDVQSGKVTVHKFDALSRQIEIRQEGDASESAFGKLYCRIVLQTLPVECSITCPPLGVAGYEKTKQDWIAENLPQGEYPLTLLAMGKSLECNLQLASGWGAEIFADFVAGTLRVSQRATIPLNANLVGWLVSADRLLVSAPDQIPSIIDVHFRSGPRPVGSIKARGAAYSATENLVAIIGEDNHLHLWDPSNTEKPDARVSLDSASGVTGCVAALKTVAFFSNGRITVVETTRGALLRILEADPNCTSFGLIADGPSVLFATHIDGSPRVQRIAVKAKRPVMEYLITGGMDAAIRSICVDRTGRILAVQINQALVDLFNIETGKRLASISGSDITAISLSDDGALLVIANTQGEIKLWNYEKEALVQRLQLRDFERAAITNALLSPDNKKLAATTDNGHIIIWQLE